MSYKIALAFFFGALMFVAGHYTTTWTEDPKWSFLVLAILSGIVFAWVGVISDYEKSNF